MKANITFLDNIFSEVEYKATFYVDTKAAVFRVIEALGKMFVLTNCFIKDEEKKEN